MAGRVAKWTDDERRLVAILHGIKQRCYNPKRSVYPRYGGRGITVCPEWLADPSAFIRDMGPRPSDKHTIDRKNPDGPYSKRNCRWATYEEQNTNRRNSLRVTLNGVKMTIPEAARLTGLSYGVVFGRAKRGTRGLSLMKLRESNP